MIVTQYTLVNRLREGGRDVTDDWKKFWAIYEKPILSYALSLFEGEKEESETRVEPQTEEDCKRVLQETMVELEIGLSKFQPAKGRFYDFLMNVVKNHVLHVLVARVREGGSGKDWESNWGRLFALYREPLLACALKGLGRTQDCEDVLQEASKWLFKNGLSKFEYEKGKFLGFLMKVVSDRVKDELRRRKRVESRTSSIETEDAGQVRDLTSKSPAEVAEHKGRLALISQVLDYLLQHRVFERRTVAMFKAVVFEDKEPAEVALAFHTSRGNVDQAKSAVLAKLRCMVPAMEEGLDFDEALAGCSARK